MSQDLKALINQTATTLGVPVNRISLTFRDFGTEEGGFAWEASLVIFTPGAKKGTTLHHYCTGHDPERADLAMAEAITPYLGFLAKYNRKP